MKAAGPLANSVVTSSGMLPVCEQVGINNCTDGTSNTIAYAEIIVGASLNDLESGVRAGRLGFGALVLLAAGKKRQ